ncbi:uncharacterized protein LOC143174335 [Nomia melanderi]|uniref:uncharacterized protein LOC143174335 n=1 Tax=Nomia melanderi TaxID=2448451 RepID=UPI003FCEB9AE
MESKVLLWILLIAPIAAEFAHRPTGPAAKITRAAWRDKGYDSGDYKVNAGFSDRYSHQDYKNGAAFGEGSIVSKYDSLGSNLNEDKYRVNHPTANYKHHKSGLNQGIKDSNGESDGHNQEYNHGYHHSHGYRSYHHHSDNGKDGDGGYHGYYRVHFDHDDDAKGDGDHGADHDDYKGAGYHYNNEFEIHFGDDGKKNEELKYDGDSGHDKYESHFKHRDRQSLSSGHNDGADDHGTDYHYEYTSGGNYGKDYPSSADDRHYHHEQDHDHFAYRYGVVHRDH